MKRIIRALVLALVIAVLVNQPKKALADTSISNWTDMVSELEGFEPSNSYYLANDITAEDDLVITRDIILDLNGHKLSGNTGNGVITVSGSGITFTLKDTSGGGEIVNTFSSGSGEPTVVSIMNNAKFIMNSGIISGNNLSCGVYVHLGSSFDFHGGTIKNCSASNGGGIHCAGTLNMTGGTIQSCSVTDYYGGGIYMDDSSTASISGGTIDGCTAIGYGGGIFVNSDCTLTMSNVTVKNCSAQFGAGVSAKWGDAVTMNNVTFTNCNAGNSGGAFYNLGTIDIEISGCDISDCSAANEGGGISADGLNPLTVFNMVFSNSTIRDCNAKYGGGIKLAAYQKFTMTGGSITSCTAEEGGGIYSNCSVGEQTTIIIDGGTISACTATANRGGGIYLKRALCTLSAGSISGCSAQTEGGGVYLTDVQASFTMNGGTISGCSSEKGGGVYYDNGTVTLTGGKITTCTATGTGSGIYYNNPGSFHPDYPNTFLHISDSISVTGNTLAGSANNVYIPSPAGIAIRTIHIDGNLTGNIGVTVQDFAAEDSESYSMNDFFTLANPSITGLDRIGIDCLPYSHAVVDILTTLQSSSGS